MGAYRATKGSTLAGYEGASETRKHRHVSLPLANPAAIMRAETEADSVLLSLFCGAGGLDLGFEQAGFKIGLALDRKIDSVNSYNLNRLGPPVAKVQDLSAITVADLDRIFGSEFLPSAVVGGPPCQSFSQANVNQRPDDVRTVLPMAYANLVASLHERSPLDFFVMENVAGLARKKHVAVLDAVESRLADSGFAIARLMLNALDHGTPQSRPRLFLVGIDQRRFAGIDVRSLSIARSARRTVRMAIGDLPPPVYFERSLEMATTGLHPNHWCMSPRSPKFHQNGGVQPGVKGRSFKMLKWDEPSIAVAYGHREVHVHPSGRRRLSVLEAMLIQGFPESYVLTGTLSSQIDQVSEAVPPPLANAVAEALATALSGKRGRQAA